MPARAHAFGATGLTPLRRGTSCSRKGSCSVRANQHAQGITSKPPVGVSLASARQLTEEVLSKSMAIAAALTVAAAPAVLPAPASAVLSSPNAQIARSPEAALRRATPAFNADVKTVQKKLESVQQQLRIPQRKPWGGMANDIQKAQGLAQQRRAMMDHVPTGAEQDALKLIEDLKGQLERVQFAIDRKDPDKTSVATAAALNSVSQLEVLQAPALSFQVPAAYRNAPLLTGRAEVELSVEKADGSAAFIDYEAGGTLTRGTIRITLDGYSAPVNAGAFAKLVRDGKYDGKQWGSGYASVVAGKGAAPGAQVPLEILPIGEFSPVYRLPLDVRGGELPVLPLSVRGSVAMGRLDEVDGYMSGEEFFIYKFDPTQAGLAGLSFDEGEFAVFGYVTKGMEEVVQRLETGDRIVSARVVSGLDRLVNA